MGKITVKHYLNKRLKPSIVRGIFEYPVYVRVFYGRKNERVKSDWIVHTCSEYDFENDKHIIELKKYETEIINNIIERAKGVDFNLNARLGNSKDSITEMFEGGMFEKGEIKEQVINYISKKTGIRRSILNWLKYFINLCLYSSCPKAPVLRRYLFAQLRNLPKQRCFYDKTLYFATH